jgi:hypothetical protein
MWDMGNVWKHVNMHSHNGDRGSHVGTWIPMLFWMPHRHHLNNTSSPHQRESHKCVTTACSCTKCALKLGIFWSGQKISHHAPQICAPQIATFVNCELGNDNQTYPKVVSLGYNSQLCFQNFVYGRHLNTFIELYVGILVVPFTILCTDGWTNVLQNIK